MTRKRNLSDRVWQMTAYSIGPLLLAGWWLLSSPIPSPGASDKLTPEELLKLHLQSIGTPDARAKCKTRLMQGQGVLRIVTGGSGGAGGIAALASDAKRHGFLFGTQQNPTYYGEQVLFDGKRATVAYAHQNGYSQMGQFVDTYLQIVREGLLCGTLSTRWPLLDLKSRKPKLEYHGSKKIEGRPLHRLEYRPRKGAGKLKIDLYFEPDTFRHVHTTYHVAIPGGIGASPDASALQQPTYETLEEHFSDFKELDGVIFPTLWTLRFSRTSSRAGSPSVTMEWQMGFQHFAHNQAIDPTFFQPR